MLPSRCVSPRRSAARRYRRIIDATVGRLIFNDPIPQDLGYVDRSDSDKQFDLEISFLVKKKQLGNIIDRCIRVHGTARTAEVLDRIKAQGSQVLHPQRPDRCRSGCGYPA